MSQIKYSPITVLNSENNLQNGANQSGRDIEVIHSPPHYPQAKGKVERCIRNFNEEYIRLDKVFEDTSTLLEEYKEWYNNKRYHLGINDCPVNVHST